MPRRRRFLGPFHPKQQIMFQGLRTIVYPAPDLDRAKQWYSQVLNQPPSVPPC